eukprot:4992067-Pleurochrysis_carterae.AAC.1
MAQHVNATATKGRSSKASCVLYFAIPKIEYISLSKVNGCSKPRETVSCCASTASSLVRYPY